MKRALVAALAVGALVLPFSQASATRFETRSYILGAVGDLTVFCGIGGTEINVGGGCFNLTGAERAVSISVEDGLLSDVGFQARFVNAAGSRIGPWHGGCDNTSLIVPEGAVKLEVNVDGAQFGSLDCPASATRGIGTIGTINVDFFSGNPS